MFKENYEKIIESICEYKGISSRELCEILRDKDCKYMLLLLMKKYGITFELANKNLKQFSKRKIKYNYKKAQKKFLINRNFREMYFRIEDEVKNIK